MRYNEFIERMSWDESYMTYDDYTEYLEPIYMKYDEEYDGEQDKFYQKIYELYKQEVYKPLELIIMGASAFDKEQYLNGNSTVWADVDKAHDLLKRGFLKSLNIMA